MAASPRRGFTRGIAIKIAVIGTGYVGLVTGTCLAEIGNQVICVDIDEAKVKQLRKKQLPIFEPGLSELLKLNVEAGRLSFTTKLSEALTDTEIVFLALPTPAASDGSTDLSYVLDVANKLGPLLKKYCLIINKSTVPVGTAEKVKAAIKKNTQAPFDVASNPEFLREGVAVEDFMKPDRVVIGTSSARAKKLLAELYQPFSAQGTPVLFMDERSAEMTKYAANAFLATKISFMNEIANLSELTGADVDAVRLGIGADHRIGQAFLYPGIGYGGSCFPKDVSALKVIALSHGYDFKIINSVQRVNANQKNVLVRKVKKYYKDKLKNKTFALWGLAFKPDTDDIREAPALQIIADLLEAGAKIRAFDPEAMPNVQNIYAAPKTNIKFLTDQYSALNGADALLIATEWSNFRSPDFKKMKQKLKKPIIFDGRNLYDLEDMTKHGFFYQSIGRRTVKP